MLGIRRLGGFTLVEVLLVLALVGILCGLAVGGLRGFDLAGKIQPVDRLLKASVLRARALAERENGPVRLSYSYKASGKDLLDGRFVFDPDPDEKTSDDPERHRDKFRIDARKPAERTAYVPKVTFHAIVESGPIDYGEEELLLNQGVEFFAGCSPAFEARWVTKEGEPRTLRFDPFSGYPLPER